MPEATESLELYAALHRKAFEISREIARSPRPRDPSAIRIWDAARALVEGGPAVSATAGSYPSDSAVFQALDKLLTDWPDLSAGEITGEIAYAAEPDLWRRLMYEPPLGTYATLAAGLINTSLRPGIKMIELGAGVGNTSRLLNVPADASYIRTDKSVFLLNRPELPGTPIRYDFDAPPPATGRLTDADVVFAVNAMHCAEHPRQTLAYVRQMLRPGGMLILGEGEPRPAANRPWPLDVFFCQFSGWWDRTGFRTRAAWVEDLAAAGYTDIGYQRLVAGEHDLGGLIWARA